MCRLGKGLKKIYPSVLFRPEIFACALVKEGHNTGTCTYSNFFMSNFSANPSFADYLNFVNPYTYLEGPLNDLASKFNDIKDLLGDQAGAFFNSINGLANSVSGGFSVSKCARLTC